LWWRCYAQRIDITSLKMLVSIATLRGILRRVYLLFHGKWFRAAKHHDTLNSHRLCVVVSSRISKGLLHRA
jgi:hypothetical protein